MSSNDPYYDPPEDDTAVKALRARALVEPLELPLPSRRPRWFVRGIVGGVLALCLLVVGLAWYQYMGPDLAGEPVLVKADPEPYKIAPADETAVLPGEAAAGTAITGGSLPEDRIEGERETAASSPPNAPTTDVVSAERLPEAAPDADASLSATSPSSNGSASAVGTPATTGPAPALTAEAGIEPAAPPAAPAAAASSDPGSAAGAPAAARRDPNAIVADELPPPQGVAASESAPPLADAPGSLASTAPEPPATATPPAPEPVGAVDDAAIDAEGPAITELEPAPADEAVAEAAPAAPAVEPPVEDAPSEPVPASPAVQSTTPTEQVVAAIQAPAGPIPSPRKPRRGQDAEPVALSSSAGIASADTGGETVQPQAGPSAAAAAAGAPVWRVQVASLRDDASARRAWDNVRARHGEVLADVTATIVRADISSGTVYRVQVGPFESRAAADAACAALKARRADCLTVGPIR